MPDPIIVHPLLTVAWRLRFADLFDVAASGATDPMAALERAYVWRHDQLIGLSRGLAGFGAGLFTALIVALAVHGADEIVTWAIAVPTTAIALVFAAGGWVASNYASRLQEEYLAAVSVFARISPLRAQLPARGQGTP
jgi:hypothetical protein